MKHAFFETSLGHFVVELDDERAPKTVENFLDYVHSGHYEGTIFHRVINGFMVQGGGFGEDVRVQKPTGTPIENEADNGLKNDQYTLAMARTNDPHSATAQFFINVSNNEFLNHSSKTPQGWGYAVFGRVVDGTDTIDRLRQVKTGNRGFHQDVPVENVVITSAYQMDYDTKQRVVRADPLDTAPLEEPCESEAERETRLAAEAAAGKLGRQKGAVITQHLVEGAGTSLLVVVDDEPSEISGENHQYRFTGFDTKPDLSLQFQEGPIPSVGVNGVTLESVLAVSAHRLEGLQSGRFACEENQDALDHINKAIDALNRRTRARIARGVEGTHTA
jgi:peptidyl-prolyl cis-trans isomerase B (cyclophilin B)